MPVALPGHVRRSTRKNARTAKRSGASCRLRTLRHSANSSAAAAFSAAVGNIPLKRTKSSRSLDTGSTSDMNSPPGRSPSSRDADDRLKPSNLIIGQCEMWSTCRLHDEIAILVAPLSPLELRLCVRRRLQAGRAQAQERHPVHVAGRPVGASIFIVGGYSALDEAKQHANVAVAVAVAAVAAGPLKPISCV
eukprot:4672521-Pleurochrysis_carterae.AAC.2